ncbi:hypothetical protein C361_04580 [Cryptococcus neoformans Tu259-1]|uniref:Uncharacterized protein n=1 Tax=Cryptococcus neoformans Tu259-1 TaxID=1230072 RepID=A0A854Q9D5_CRYNE|nr:hypothetical protein C361_04580 [Cryptococcus neoformans var. grubii Tu259-1]
MTLSPAQSMSTLSGSSAQSALSSTLSSIISIPYKIYSKTRILYQEYQQWYDTNQPLFIFDTELSFEWARIRALWDRLKPDPEKFAPYHLPLERPYPYKDIALRRKKVTGENQER